MPTANKSTFYWMSDWMNEWMDDENVIFQSNHFTLYSECLQQNQEKNWIFYFILLNNLNLQVDIVLQFFNRFWRESTEI